MILWIWLQSCIGFASSKAKKIFEFFEKPEDIFIADEKIIRESGLFTERTIEKIMQKDLNYAKKVYNDCIGLNYKVVSIFDAEYPKRLKEISDCPLLLYVDGDIPQTENLFCAAVVGSRAATETSLKIAFDIGAGLALNDVLVVSGGADGADTAAHKGALSCGGETVCVLGCGINENYLVKNRALRNEIAKHGAVISEYPPFTSNQRYTFIQRNRIIAGICECTLVVQAGMHSGALSTAEQTLKNKRKLFIIRGRKNDPCFEGSNSLERNGATPVKNHSEILDWYKSKDHGTVQAENILNEKTKYPAKVRNQMKLSSIFEKDDGEEKKILPEQLTENAVLVYHTISDTPFDSDDIAMAAELDANVVKAALTELEIFGLVREIVGKGYIRKK